MMLQLRLIFADMFFAFPLSVVLWLSFKIIKALAAVYDILKERFSDEKPKHRSDKISKQTPNMQEESLSPTQ